MNAEFRRPVEIYVFECIACIAVEQPRPDIQNFLRELQEGQHTNELIFDRVCEYLKSHDLLDRDNQLTEYGEYVLENGLFFQKEEGKYRFWCTKEDVLLRTTLLYFRREKPEKFNKEKRRQPSEKLTFEKLYEQIHHTISLQNDAQDKETSLIVEVLQIGGDEGMLGIPDYNNAVSNQVQLIWNWNGFENSEIHLEGRLVVYGRDKNIDKNSYSFEYDLERFFIALAEYNQCNYDTQYKRLKISWQEAQEEQNTNVCLNFLLTKNFDTHNFEHGEYSSAIFSDIPIMPKTLEDAIAWRNYLVDKQLVENYTTESEFKNIIQKIQQHPAFSAYIHTDFSRALSIEKFLSILQSQNKNKRTPSFWHLSAPYDLSI